MVCHWPSIMIFYPYHCSLSTIVNHHPSSWHIPIPKDGGEMVTQTQHQWSLSPKILLSMPLCQNLMCTRHTWPSRISFVSHNYSFGQSYLVIVGPRVCKTQWTFQNDFCEQGTLITHDHNQPQSTTRGVEFRCWTMSTVSIGFWWLHYVWAEFCGETFWVHKSAEKPQASGPAEAWWNPCCVKKLSNWKPIGMAVLPKIPAQDDSRSWWFSLMMIPAV